MPRVSIILTHCIRNRFQCHMTMQAIANIVKFTDVEDYELILVGPKPAHPIRDDYKVLKIDKDIVLDPDPGYTAAMNQGAQIAEGKVLVFIQNDVFVHEGWLRTLLRYIDALYEAVFPDQVPRDRAYVKEAEKRHFLDPEAKKGGRDAGLLMITKAAFKRTGGWNESLGLLCDRDFYNRMNKASVAWTDTNKVIITHIMAATNLNLLDENPKEYNRRMEIDAKQLNK